MSLEDGPARLDFLNVSPQGMQNFLCDEQFDAPKTACERYFVRLSSALPESVVGPHATPLPSRLRFSPCPASLKKVPGSHS
jgi:hypothetical protein